MTAEDRETEQPSLSMSMFASVESYLRAKVAAERARADAAERDARRYVKLRAMLFENDFEVGEAYISMKVVGMCPSFADLDAAIDASTEGVQHGSERDA